MLGALHIYYDWSFLMVSRPALYSKFGLASECAQLLETSLGTMLIGSRGVEHAQENYDFTQKATLGRVLRQLERFTEISPDLMETLRAGVVARNRIQHGFFLRLGLAIQSESGRSDMFDELEEIHSIVLRAWQLADTMSGLQLQLIAQSTFEGRKDRQ